MKKIVIAFSFLFAISFVSGPYVADAVTTNDSQSQIEYLQGLITKLQAQLDALLSGKEVEQTVLPAKEVISVPPLYCPPIERLLSVGSEGDDVKGLQEFLSSTGDYTYGEITGYYGPITQSAVQRFQARAGVVSSGDPGSTGYGVFGPLTQKAIYRYCRIPDPVACTMEYDPVCGQPPMPKIDCPVGAFCAQPATMPAPTTYSNMCHLKAAGAEFLYEGACGEKLNPEIPKNCKVWYDGCNTCSRTEPGGMLACTMMACFEQGTPYCKAYFEDDGNKPPVISSFSGPTVLNVDETGTWTIKASDSENDDLSYYVTWGDEELWNVISPTAELDLATKFVQTTTFEHAYDAVGVYTVTVVVMDEERQQTKTSTTVKVVEEDPVACTTEYAPVCGQITSCIGPDNPWIMAPCYMQQKTFSNLCYMKSAGYSFAYDGECDTDPIYLQ